MRRACACALVTLLLPCGAFAGGPARAPGNALNPSGSDPTRDTDPRGMSYLRQTRRRTPTGFLYPYPYAPDRLAEIGRGWLARGSLESGGLYTSGDTSETRFEEYADWNDGALLSFDLSSLHRESGFTLDAAGGSVGRDDAFYYGELGWLNRVRLRGSFDRIPHTFAKDAQNLFRGAGSSTLTLPAPLVPGNNSPAAVAAALAENPGRSTLDLEREETQLSLDFRALEPLTLFASYQRDDQHGERPFGGSLGYEVGQIPAQLVETTQPIRWNTHAFSAGARYATPRVQGNLAYNGSFFRNDTDYLTWDNPFLAGAGFAFPGASNVMRGRFVLAPDNDWHNAKGDLAFSLPWNGRVNATLSYARTRQDDSLIAPTVNSGSVGIPGLNGIDLGQWNSASALSQNSADLAVDTWLANLRLRVRPWRPLSLGARLRFYERDQDTDYTAFNPATGQIGYVAEDGAFNVLPPPTSRVFTPGQATENFQYRSIAFGYQKLLAEATADWRVRSRTTLGVRYAWEQTRRDHREREKTWDHSVRLSATSRELAWSTWRMSYEFTDRTGDSYDFFPYQDAFVSSLGAGDPVCAGLAPGAACFVPTGGVLRPFTLAQLRKSDLASRTQHRVRLRVNFPLRDDMDLALVGAFDDDDYGADYGLESDRGLNANLEWSYQPSPRWQGYAFGSFGKRFRKLRNINDAGPSVTTSDPNAGGALFPLANAWRLEDDETTASAGAGLRARLLDRVTLDASYSFSRVSQDLDYQFASASALAPGVGAAGAGGGFPDLVTQDHFLQTNLRVELRPGIALRFFYLYRRASIDDFRQDGITPLGLNGSLFLGHTDEDFSAHAFGTTLQLRFPAGAAADEPAAGQR